VYETKGCKIVFLCGQTLFTYSDTFAVGCITQDFSRNAHCTAPQTGIICSSTIG